MTYTLLSLGDSYTIGEGVQLPATYPYQAVQMLRRQGHPFTAPEIIARTGWTTDELADAIAGTRLLPAYDFVSLLIGVNNQYRGRSCEEYGLQFEALLDKAINFAGGRAEHVFVLSIPDWGVTPFAEGRDRKAIADEINAFNIANRSIALAYKCHYIDITAGTRQHGTDEQYLTPDKLHYSGKEYHDWALKLTPAVAAALKS